MNHLVEKLENSKVKITVTLSPEEFDVYKEEALAKLIANAEIKGFRKGKAPKSMYLKKYGEGDAIQKAIDSALNKTYPEVIKAENIKVMDQPEIDVDFERFGKDKTFSYTAVVLVLPEVELGQYFGVEVTRDSKEVTEDEINNRIKTDLVKKSDLELVEDGVLENGHTAVFDFEGFKDGVAFEGGKAENYTLVIGSGQFIPGFEEQMLGMKSGEEKTIEVTFPENYQAEELKGAKAEFKVKLHEVKKSVVPELTDELVVDLAYENVTNVEEYKEFIKKELESQKAVNVERKFEDDLLSKVTANAKVDVPEELVHSRVHDRIHQEEGRAKQYGLTFEQLLQYQGLTLDKYEEMITPMVRQTVLDELVLDKIVQVENLELTDEDYEFFYNEYANNTKHPLEEVKKQLPKDRIKYQFLINKAIKLIKEKAIMK